ncbi:MAG: PAS domain-containing protein [Planctomycetes bacterium]|nr:PAS domain-containing protein [Planctomycetota bacterium]
MDDPFFEELKRFVGFGPQDEERLAALRPAVLREEERIVNTFYARLLLHEGALRAIPGGEAQVDRLKESLSGWLREFVSGPYDEAYVASRDRIGRRHVQVGLEQHYMLTAMDLIRHSLVGLSFRECTAEGDALRETVDAVDRLCAMDLAITLRAYREDYISRLRQGERLGPVGQLATVGEMAGEIAHELGNMLAGVGGATEILARRLAADSSLRAVAEEVAERAAQARGVVRDLMDYAREVRPRCRPVPCRLLMDDALDLARGAVGRPGLRLELHHDDPELAPAVDRPALQRALGALVAEASAGGDTVRAGTRAEGERVLFWVEDEAGPVPSPALAQAFTPLTTLRRERPGLELAIARKVAQAHGGEVAALATGRGLRLELRLPLFPPWEGVPPPSSGGARLGLSAAMDQQRRITFDHAPHAIAGLDRDGRVLLWNPAAQGLTGWGRDEVVGRRLAEVFPRDTERRRIASRLERVFRGETLLATEAHLTARDGSSRQILESWFPITEEDGAVLYAVGMFTDLTTQRRLERDLADQEALAALGRMAATVAHEVRNPLAGIRSAVSVLGRRLAAAGLETGVEEILGRIDDLDTVTRDLLDFARPVRVRRRPVRIREVLESVTACLAADPEFTAVRFGVEAPAGTSVEVDPDRLRQAAFNLCHNAAQAVGAGGHVRVAARVADGALEVTVTDDGPGVPEEVQARLFNPFFTTKAVGSGLGLTVVRRVAEAHGGSVRHERPPQGGACFRLVLPLGAEGASPAPPAAGPPPGGP